MKLTWSVLEIGWMIFLRAEILKRLKPCVEYRFGGRIVFHIPAVNRARARVEVEIDVKFVTGLFIRLTRQIFLNVFLRTEQAFFFAAPQCHSYGSPRPGTDRFKNAHRFKGRRGTV